ncbi:MAG TPA: type II toxin-antitoxin system VapC family toxin [Thermomicrobiaceae bacterium]|nr:type II toxin-antitoxin system VapC family toxin [Thermomicrobiaceae bacterium]
MPEASSLIAGLAPSGIAISIITYMEAYQGVLQSTNQSGALADFEAFVDVVPILPLPSAVARRCATLREQLRRQGRRLRARALDLIIAAMALERDLILVTRNIDDYRDIPELRIYSTV